jgi:hypothetical protein
MVQAYTGAYTLKGWLHNSSPFSKWLSFAEFKKFIQHYWTLILTDSPCHVKESWASVFNAEFKMGNFNTWATFHCAEVPGGLGYQLHVCAHVHRKVWVVCSALHSLTLISG